MKLLTFLVVAAVLAAGCTSPAGNGAGGAGGGGGGGGGSQLGVAEFTLTAKQWEFVPAEIRVKKGQQVKLTITSADVTHGFSLPDFTINRNLEPGKATVIEFVPDRAGTFTFACSVLCGTGHPSMKGKLVVE